MQISQRFHNDTYAPGIATYGIQGKDGEQGTPGTSLFFSEYSLPGEYLDFVRKITSRMLPVKNQQIQLKRKFVNGDQFVDPDGKVYLLMDINQLIRDINNGTNQWSNEKLKYIGKFNSTDNSNIFSDTNNSGTLRAHKFIISDDSKTATGSGLLTVSHINKDTDNDINFINLESLYSGQHDMNLDIKFSKKYNGFMISSKYPVYLNANVYTKFNNTNNTNNDYSPVYTTADNKSKPITDYIASVKDLSCKLDASIYSYTKKDTSIIYYGVVYKISFVADDNESDTNQWNDFVRTYDNGNTVIHFQNKDHSDFIKVMPSIRDYNFRQDYDYVKLNDLINKVQYTDLPNVAISVINGIEAYVNIKNKNMSGIRKRTTN
ncbi:MAG: hypothetical protein [phage Lak_Megaphage_RVC_AP4_GC26]|uniref:Tail fiber protein n=1 Tax=phage Lak_Megaphage_RVC_AP3_GC26 TaxID=3109225 RepID=A0ABZ0YZP0_9CAUD|nr:MAG: hypothetical protein [phage Lak_Megaphage_RVC_AP3_GC26]WQJ52372.1 MAG: hypothetical protein [phage Lak_Megaphage_RVC_AP4_GC26]